MTIKEKAKVALGRLNAKNRIPFYIPLFFVPAFLLFYLVPFLSTNIDGNIRYISGYQAFLLFQDSESLIHYGAGLLIASLILSCCLLIPSLVGLLGEERFLAKAAFSALAVLIVKLLVEIAVTILFGKTETNITPSFGSYLIPSLTLVFAFAFILVYINFRDKKGTTFRGKEDSQTTL